jgi:hypothetical protein
MFQIFIFKLSEIEDINIRINSKWESCGQRLLKHFLISQNLDIARFYF